MSHPVAVSNIAIPTFEIVLAAQMSANAVLAKGPHSDVSADASEPTRDPD
jgi:hypothetical protein